AGITAAVVAIVAAVALGTTLDRTTGATSATAPSAAVVVPSSPITGGTATTPATTGTVVNIDTMAASESGGLQPLGAGSGMVLTSGGEILTNNHVVQGAEKISVSVPGQGTALATVVGVDTANDIAVLQLQSLNGLTLKPMSFGDSSSVAVGDQITALGNAYGNGGTPKVVTGTVTAVDKTIQAGDSNDPVNPDTETLHGVIEVSANVVPGDSGGPLLNDANQVIGIITAGPGHGGSGIGYAIPITPTLDVVNKIRAGEESGSILIGPRGFLGVAVNDLDAATAQALGLSDLSGVVIDYVRPNSAADKLGLAQGAVIRSVDGTQIVNGDTLGAVLHAKTPGQTVQITWVDAKGTHSGTATLTGGGPAV
ncbi:MAG TPA: trypsin-like peptidase domain-containing protein, partial [Actinomycetota bacterium]|nr:trypsin-like peptidase domain-containing protein [Actinomycetota bacterium]